MDIKKTLKRLHDSNEFKLWEKDHKEFYLAHIFVMMDEANKGICQIGYYSDKADKMVTFVVEPEQISVTPEQEVIKAKQQIKKLDPEKIKVSVEKALETAKKCVEDNYKNEMLMKSFFIIQQLDDAPLFNITYLTHGFKSINIKISALDGKIEKHTIGVLAKFS